MRVMKRVVLSGIALAAIFTTQALSAEAWIISDTTLAPIRFASADLREAMAAKGNAVVQKALKDVAVTPSGVRVIVGLLSNINVITQLAAEGGAAVGGLRPQGYAIRVTGSAQKSYWVIGNDSIGALYGGLEIAEAVKYNSLGSVINSEHAPYIGKRSIKFNIPLDARTPSYSDAGDAAWANVVNMWEYSFWTEFLDQMVRFRYNTLTLWSLQPFPTLVKVPEYPNVSLSDVKKNTIPFEAKWTAIGMTPPKVLANLATVKTMTIDDKIAFWRKVMSYGHSLGIEFYLYTWNVYTDGIYDPRITVSMNNQTTLDYYRKSIRELITTYPHIAGIGITTGEQMTWSAAKDEPWMWNAYGEGLALARAANPGRSIRLIHRAHASNPSTIWNYFKTYPDTFDFSVKYSHDRMYCSLKPGYGLPVLNNLPTGKRTWLEIRNDDIYVLRWGDPDWARTYIQNIPQINKVVGFNMGFDGYVLGREYFVTEPETPAQSYIYKHWYNFMTWGRLAYDPQTSSAVFKNALSYRFPQVNTAMLYDAWASCSKIIPTVNRAHYYGMDFEWYPEACYSAPPPEKRGFHTVRDFITVPPLSGERILSVPAHVHNWKIRATSTDTSVVQIAQMLKKQADAALTGVSTMNPGGNKELRLTISDIRAMSWLGHYYAEKFLGAVDLCKYDSTKQQVYRDSSVMHLRLAAQYWRNYASEHGTQYKPQIFGRVGVTPVDLKAFMSRVLNDIVIAGGSSQLASSQPSPGDTVIEAETATVQGGATITASSGNTGAGYVDLTGSGSGSIQFTCTVPTAGLYTLEFRYAMESGNVPVTLSVNGSTAAVPLSFWTTGSKSIWQAETRNVSLVAGNNIIALTWAQKWGVLDHLNIIPLATTGILPSDKNSLSGISSFMRRGQLTITMQAVSASPIECIIFNAQGQVVKRQVHHVAKPGFQTMAIGTQTLQAGCYFVLVKTGNAKVLKKVTVVK